jgi:hypothetical protein
MLARSSSAAHLFLNLENILDVRQTRYDPLLLPRRARDGRWTVDVWAPTDGFVANGGRAPAVRKDRPLSRAGFI